MLAERPRNAAGTVVAGSKDIERRDAGVLEFVQLQLQVLAGCLALSVGGGHHADAVVMQNLGDLQRRGVVSPRYRIYREGIADPVASVGADVLSTSIEGVWAGYTAMFADTALNAAGESPPSSASDPVTVPDGATGKHRVSGWGYTVTMNLWRGEEGPIYRLYENGAVIATKQLTFAGSGAQSVSITRRRSRRRWRWTAERREAMSTGLSSPTRRA